MFVDLSLLTEAAHVLPALAHALGVRETGGAASLADATAARARGLEDCLLVVDNCERVVEAGPELAALVAACPKLRVLATSREPLHVAAEREFPLEPLKEADAVAFFVERGRKMRSSFAPDDAVAREVCRRSRLLAARARARGRAHEPVER